MVQFLQILIASLILLVGVLSIMYQIYKNGKYLLIGHTWGQYITYGGGRTAYKFINTNTINVGRSPLRLENLGIIFIERNKLKYLCYLISKIKPFKSWRKSLYNDYIFNHYSLRIYHAERDKVTGNYTIFVTNESARYDEETGLVEDKDESLKLDPQDKITKIIGNLDLAHQIEEKSIEAFLVAMVPATPFFIRLPFLNNFKYKSKKFWADKKEINEWKWIDKEIAKGRGEVPFIKELIKKQKELELLKEKLTQ